MKENKNRLLKRSRWGKQQAGDEARFDQESKKKTPRKEKRKKVPGTSTGTAKMYISVDHQIRCLTAPVVPSVMWGGIFSVMVSPTPYPRGGIPVVLMASSSLLQGVFQGQPFSPRGFGRTAGFIYVYHALMCPMEAISGRSSLVHNALSGGTLGYIGVASRNIGIPFLNANFFFMNPRLPPPVVGAVVYGGIAGVLGGFSGKQI